MKLGYLIIPAASIIALTSCQFNRNQTTGEFDDTQANTLIEMQAEDDLNKSKAILYTLPSPIEIASIIKESDVKYDEDLLNNISNSERYTSGLKMALNLGIYSSDMSLASMFNQSQKTVEYLNSLKSLSSRLGIAQLIDDETISRLESKGTTKDEMLDIISEVYMKINNYLTENNRKNVATMVLVGGWTEGLYVALNIADVNADKNRLLAERIIGQKMALNTVIDIIESTPNAENDQDLIYLKGKMNEIKVILDEVHLETNGQITTETDAENHLTIIHASKVNGISAEILTLLRDKVNEIRAEFIK
ncbi:MAG: hypothetical protein K6G73_09430 [Marinilabiliaceae bacterium]|nr:hypothetical protein [Marinilabiliaceae bacterium]